MYGIILFADVSELEVWSAEDRDEQFTERQCQEIIRHKQVPGWQMEKILGMVSNRKELIDTYLRFRQLLGNDVRMSHKAWEELQATNAHPLLKVVGLAFGVISTPETSSYMEQLWDQLREHMDQDSPDAIIARAMIDYALAWAYHRKDLGKALNIVKAFYKEMENGDSNNFFLAPCYTVTIGRWTYDANRHRLSDKVIEEVKGYAYKTLSQLKSLKDEWAIIDTFGMKLNATLLLLRVKKYYTDNSLSVENLERDIEDLLGELERTLSHPKITTYDKAGFCSVSKLIFENVNKKEFCRRAKEAAKLFRQNGRIWRAVEEAELSGDKELVQKLLKEAGPHEGIWTVCMCVHSCMHACAYVCVCAHGGQWTFRHCAYVCMNAMIFKAFQTTIHCNKSVDTCTSICAFVHLCVSECICTLLVYIRTHVTYPLPIDTSCQRTVTLLLYGIIITCLPCILGFTERDCSILYLKAIQDNPTITLHVSKAMTIGPPRAGKTALRRHLLELEPPEVSSSTPVMTTAETVSVCPSGSGASPGWLFGHVPPLGSGPSIEDSSESEDTSSSDESDDPMRQKVVEKNRFKSHMCLVTKNKWTLVNSDSGILSLLTYLRDIIAARSSTTQKPVGYEKGAEDSNLPSSHEDMHHEAAIQPSGVKSDSVTVISRIYRELQNPDLADVALSDEHLLQFLDCGGQLAYHDILPLFVNIPAIYLNVFNVTEELTECPTDELCSTEGNKMYAAKSALSVAEMVTRSVMTVRSLADRKVPLLPGVISESKPRVILVGTHLDKLDEKNADEKLKASNEILQKALQLKSRLLERVVVPNEKSQLMFFPVNNKLYVDKSHQSHKRCKCKHCRATKNLKGRITKQAMEDAVKVEVPVRWYLHQLLELSQSEKPFYSYSKLYERCKAEDSVTDVGEFHAMVTYFHALGLLIHLCGADVGHTEESACLVFTNPSHLFENISKLYLVQFVDIRGGEKVLLKHEGKLTRNALRDLGVELDPDYFMDLLVQLFIGAEITSQEGGRVLFVPSVLTSSPDDAAPSGVSTGSQEDSLGFAVTFESTSFIPCGVFTGMSARLQNAPGWEIFTKSISRKRMTFTVGTEGTVTLFDHATHISVSMERHEGKCREYRDTVIEAVADSYCFLFHSMLAKHPQSGPCSECVKSPYLVLGQTCQECRAQCDTPEAPHFAELKVDCVAKTVRCKKITTVKKLSKSECDLFQKMSHYVSQLL